VRLDEAHERRAATGRVVLEAFSRIWRSTLQTRACAYWM